MQKQATLERDAETATGAKGEEEASVPDVFALPPLLRKQATAKVMKVGPAPFTFIDDVPGTSPEG